jgi:ubiquinone/menaquinone biosynthesis C-methylase UbiE
MSVSFSEPRDIILHLGLKEGMKVGDFGAGSGHYSRAAAAIVGYSGRVYAVDVQENVLKHLKLNTHDHHLATIETVWGDVEKLGGSHLRDATLDAVILANTLFQIHMKDRDGLLAEMRRVLKPGGKLLVVDWKGSYGGIGPAPEHVVPKQDAEKLFTDAGFVVVSSFEAGSHHYGIVFTSPS